MSYTYLLEQGEESSAESFSDIAPSALSKSMSTAARPCSNGNAMESFHGSRSGTTLRPSMGHRGKEKSMSSAAGFRARTSAQPGKGPVLMERGAGYGQQWPASLAKYDPDSSSWKTHQCSLLGGWEPFSETWPKWGMMLGGEFWELPAWGRSTQESEYGFLPTPLASDGDGGAICRTKNGREYNLRDWWANQGLGRKGQDRTPEFWEWVMGWPMGWSGVEPLETDKFRTWLQLHGISYDNANVDLPDTAAPGNASKSNSPAVSG